MMQKQMTLNRSNQDWFKSDAAFLTPEKVEPVPLQKAREITPVKTRSKKLLRLDTFQKNLTAKMEHRQNI